MSTKQMAYAAVKGRKLTVHGAGGAAPVHGYLVGMDDFHWLLAEITWPGDGGKPQVDTHLIHKSAPRIRISHTTSLSDEHDDVQALVNEIGRSFFAHCQEKILARSTTTRTSTTQEIPS